MLKDLVEASKLVLSRRKYQGIFFAAAALFALAYIYIPIFVTPGNDLEFFIAITPWWGFVAIALLSISMGLLISMQAYSFLEFRSTTVKSSAGTIGASFSGLMSGIFTSATCASCVGALFSFLGVGGVLFLLEHRWEIVGLTFAIIGVSLHLTSKKVIGDCEACRI